MTSLPPDLQSILERDPDSQVDLIVRLANDPSRHFDELNALGWQVRRTFSLTSFVALTGRISAAVGLAHKPWVVTIELDKPVHTM